MHSTWCGSFGVSMPGRHRRRWRHLPLRRPAPGGLAAARVRHDVTGVAFGPADVGGGDCGDPAQVVGERGAAVEVPRDGPGQIHSHQRGHLVTSKIWTIWVPGTGGLQGGMR